MALLSCRSQRKSKNRSLMRFFSRYSLSECKPGRGAPSGNKNAETHGYYRRKIRLEAVSFDLNFSSSGGEQLPKRFIELLNHCGGEHLVSAVRRRLHRVPARLVGIKKFHHIH